MIRATVVISALAGAMAVGAVGADAQIRGLDERGAAGRPGSGWVGISFSSSPPPASDVVVEDVIDSAPAERAGVLIGDRIVLWNGRSDVAAAIRGTRLSPGDTVRVRVQRPGARDRDLVMVAVPRPFALGPGTDQELRQTIEELSARLRRQSDSLRVRSEEVRAAGGRGMFLGPPPTFDFEEFNRAFGDAQRRAAPWAAFEGLQEIADSALNAEGFRRFGSGQGFEGMDGFAFGPGFGVMIMGGRSAVAGAELTDLGGELGSYFGTDSGALVLRVLPRTPADQAGLQDGDVIVAAGGREVASVTDLRRAVAEGPSGSLELEVVRRGNRETLTIGGGN